MKIADNIKEEIIRILNIRLGENYLLMVFGSFANGKGDRSSDIDLAVYSSEKISAKAMVEIKEELDEKVRTLRQIDLVNLTDENINPDLLRNIMREGLVWRKQKNSEELLKNLKRRLLNTKK
jgi:predicted nucleotidyltransferase